MAAPTPSARGTPLGKQLIRGFRSKITFSGHVNVSIWEIEVKPPGVDGGAAIDLSTMWNDKLRTKAPGELVELTDVSGKAGYRSEYLADILSLVNKEVTITILWPDNKGICFYGSLTKFEPDPHKERTMPTASFTVIVTNRDPVAGTEEQPVTFDWGMGT